MKNSSNKLIVSCVFLNFLIINLFFNNGTVSGVESNNGIESTLVKEEYLGEAKTFVALNERINISDIEFEPILPHNYKIISRPFEWATDSLGKYFESIILKDDQGQTIEIPLEIWVLIPTSAEDIETLTQEVEGFIGNPQQKQLHQEIDGYLKHENFSRIVNRILNNGTYTSSITYEVEHVLNYSFSSDGSVTTTIDIQRTNHHSIVQEQAVSDYVQDKINEWGLDDSGLSDTEKVGILHDKIIFNAAYVTNNVAGYKEATYQGFDKIYDVSIHSPYAITEYGLGVCQSYATLFQRFCEELDIPSQYVLGTRNMGGIESHSWNKVQLDGQWYNIDLTWDDPLLGTIEESPYSGAENWKYFLKSDDTFMEDHTFTTGKDIIAPDDYHFE